MRVKRGRVLSPLFTFSTAMTRPRRKPGVPVNLPIHIVPVVHPIGFQLALLTLGSVVVDPYWAWDKKKDDNWIHYTCPEEGCDYTVLNENFSRMNDHGWDYHKPRIVFVKDRIINV